MSHLNAALNTSSVLLRSRNLQFCHRRRSKLRTMLLLTIRSHSFSRFSHNPLTVSNIDDSLVYLSKKSTSHHIHIRGAFTHTYLCCIRVHSYSFRSMFTCNAFLYLLLRFPFQMLIYKMTSMSFPVTKYLSEEN